MEKNQEILQKAIKGSLKVIDQDREKEIVARRFGLSGQKETLEQIGSSLSITRERVRQLEKAIIIRLQIAAEENLVPELAPAEKLIIRNLTEAGRIARITDLAEKIYGRKATESEISGLNFIATFSQNLTIIDDSNIYYAAIGIAEYGSPEKIRSKINEITQVIKANKEPMTLDELDEVLNYEHPSHIAALASISKQLSTLNNAWGLASWPIVNPKNIRDKIYVTLLNKKGSMHFSEIAEEILKSDFQRKNVTVQAIHNELIKDPRFVLIGRGTYALASWGYKKGTVSDVIISILQEAKSPLSRKEIVKRVLQSRKVKETTVLLNLQNKKLFNKVDKDSYTLV